MAENVGSIVYTVTADTTKLLGQEQQVARSLGRMGKEGDKLEAKMRGIASAISAVISAIAIESVVSKVIAAQRQFDVMFASLKTMTGGVDQATAAWERLEKFASTTPYSLQQSVDGFTKLKALGLDPTERAMTSFGNTAAAMGKDLTQMIEAVADASTGEFERLKEFGIKAKQEGDKVSLTFQGVTKTIGNNSREITEYLTAIGENQFAGAMSERMKTLDGDISNLSDSMDALYRTIAQSGFGDAIATGVRAASEAIQEATQSIKDGELTEYFQKLRPYIQATEVAVTTLAAAITGRLVVALAAKAAAAYTAAAAMGAATVAARGFTIALAMMGGPIGIAITALGLLAWNWDKITGAAKSAADVSESAAARIASALAKSPGAATRSLKAQLDEASKTLADIDGQIESGSVRSIYGDRGPVAGADAIAKLKAQRDEVAAVVGDIRRAMNSVGAGAGRGSVNPALVNGGDAAPPAPSPGKPQKFDAARYLAGLSGAVADEWQKISIIEAEALRQNEENLKAKRYGQETFEAAKTLIAQNATQDRQAVMAKETEQYLDEMSRRYKLEQEQKAAREKGQDAAWKAIAGPTVDPVQRIREQMQLEIDAQEEYRQLDLENAQIYEEAKQAIRDRGAAEIVAITKAEEDAKLAAQQAALQAQLVGVSSAFGNMAEITRSFAGEQSSAYKAMFALSKGFAIADASLKLSMAVMQAMADPTALTPIQKFANYTAIASAGASILGSLRSSNYSGGRQYGGPVSADSLYRVNEKGAPEMFTAANGSQYMMPTTSGRVTAADSVGGGAQWSIVVNNTAPGATATASVDSTSRTVTIAVQEVASQIRTNTGPVWSALKSATNTTSRL